MKRAKTTQLKNKKTMMMMMILIIMSVLVQPTTPSRAYRYYSYSEIIQKFRDLNEQFPNVTKVYTMQEKYGRERGDVV